MTDVTRTSPSTATPTGGDLVRPDDYPKWVPGRVLLQGKDDPQTGATIRAFRYGQLDVTLPPVRDYLVVAYHRGTANMRRQFDGRWSNERLGHGDVTLLTRAVETRWVWKEPIDVVHVHLTVDLMRSVCQQMYDRDISEVRLRDELKAGNPAVFRAAMALAAQAKDSGPGSRILHETLACQLAVQLLRRHSETGHREAVPPRGMPQRLLGGVEEFVRENIDRSLSLEELSAVVGLSRYHFARRFREETGTTPHDFVLGARVEAAATMLHLRRDLTLSQVASACGFSDQSHLTRVFKARIGTTPGRYRAER